MKDLTKTEVVMLTKVWSYLLKALKIMEKLRPFSEGKARKYPKCKNCPLIKEATKRPEGMVYGLKKGGKKND